MTVVNNSDLDEDMLKIIKKLAIAKNTSQDVIIEEYLQKGLEKEKEEAEKALLMEIRVGNKDLKEGNYVEGDIDKIAKRYLQISDSQ